MQRAKQRVVADELERKRHRTRAREVSRPSVAATQKQNARATLLARVPTARLIQMRRTSDRRPSDAVARSDARALAGARSHLRA